MDERLEYSFNRWPIRPCLHIYLASFPGVIGQLVMTRLSSASLDTKVYWPRDCHFSMPTFCKHLQLVFLDVHNEHGQSTVVYDTFQVKGQKSIHKHQVRVYTVLSCQNVMKSELQGTSTVPYRWTTEPYTSQCESQSNQSHTSTDKKVGHSWASFYGHVMTIYACPVRHNGQLDRLYR